MWSWEFLGSVFQGTTLDFLLDAVITQTGFPPLPILVFCVFFFLERILHNPCWGAHEATQTW